jgi:hypothetical protein
MRLALALPLLLLAACIQQSMDPGPGPGPEQDPGWGTGPGGTGGNAGFGCEHDTDCGSSFVCARDGECLSSTQVKTIHVTWTVSAQPASADTCTSMPHLDLTFFDTANDEFGFSPVPCAEGKFTIDKLPSWYGSVELSRTGDYGAGGASGTFDASGTAALDLVY